MIDFKEIKLVADDLFRSHDNGRYVLYPDKIDIPDFRMCRYSALLSKIILEKLTGSEWIIEGGDVWLPLYPKGGFFDGREWCGHYWVTDGLKIVDMAARQFGVDEGYIVTSCDDDRYLSNYDEDEINEHIGSVKRTVDRWVKGLERANVIQSFDKKPSRRLGR